MEGIAAWHFSIKTKAAGKTATEAARSCPASMFNISLPTFGTFSVRKNNEINNEIHANNVEMVLIVKK